jgi:uncharacterized protein YjbI with pentapeptide repeats
MPVAFVTLMLAVAASAAPAAAQTTDADKLAAEVAKLDAETEKLERDNALLGRLPAYGAVLAGLVALGGLGTTLRQQRVDRRKDKEDADAQRERDREERTAAQTKRFDEQFTQIVQNLTSVTPAVRASAAAAIRTFLKPEHARFHEQVVTLLSANLKFPRGDLTDRIVGSTYAQALQDHKDDLPALCGPAGPDLLEATLKRADLSGLDLSGCDMFRANLRGSSFAGARLRKVNARQADLSSARLTNADLEAAHMERAILERARLGGARLVSTKLQEANAQRADNAFFRGARFDAPALASILDAVNWRKANMDADVRRELEDMDAERT